MMKGQKGITLVALIITIIVMLILVGVSISVAMNGGLFDQADEAAKGTKRAQVSEAAALAKAEMLSTFYAADTNEERKQKTADEAEKLVESYLGDAVKADDLEVSLTGKTYTITTGIDYIDADPVKFTVDVDFATANS